MSHISVYTHVFMVTESDYVINIVFQAFLCPTWSSLFSETEYFFHFDAVPELIVIDNFRAIVQVNPLKVFLWLILDSCRVGPKEHFLR